MPFANNNGVKIRYEVEGEGQPLILQHGLSGSLERWRASGYAQELNKEYRLILVDARGHGQSDKPHNPQDYTWDKFASDYVAILDDLGINKANYFGYSTGAAIGFKGIARYALSRFNSLVLGAYNPMGPIPAAERLYFDDIINGWRLAAKEGCQSYIASWEKRYGKPFDPERIPSLLANDPEAIFLVIQRCGDGIGVEDILPQIDIHGQARGSLQFKLRLT